MSETTPSATQPVPASSPPQLKCVHCGVTSTPLWRAGPAGPKTLCNACGVRWKKTGSVVPRAKRVIAKSTRKENPSSSSSTHSTRNTTTVQAPHPVRVHDDSYGRTYESVFAGLMEVPRAARARTRTPRAQLFFDGIARASAAPSPPPVLTNSTSPAVYVTETLAPSPSPSPPPLPRMEPFPEGQGFRLVMHVKPDHRDEQATTP